MSRTHILICSGAFLFVLVLILFFFDGSPVLSHGSTPVVNTSCGYNYSQSCRIVNDCTWCHEGSCWTVVTDHGPDSSCCVPNAGNSCVVFNQCGQYNVGTVQCNGSCSASAPPLPPGLYSTCYSSPNACGQVGSGYIDCSGSCTASTPPLPPGYGSACNFNACGQAGGVIDCSGSCSGSPPPLPPGYGSACNFNACGQAGGVIDCSGSCSGSPPPLPPGYGSACNFNSCGMAGGTIDCSGSCSGAPPPESLCNSSPSATNPSRSVGSYCLAPSPPYILSWTFSDPDGGDSQSAYQVQVATDAGFGTIVLDTGQVNSSSAQYAPPGLAYNTTYYWRVRVRDTNGPEWSSYSTGPQFATAPHAYPTPSFDWTPASPSANEAVSFTDSTTFAPGSSSPTWEWDFADTGSSTDQNPEHTFVANGSYNVSLESCDNAGCCVDNSQSVNVGIPFPEWEEVSPIGTRFIRLLGTLLAPFGFFR